MIPKLMKSLLLPTADVKHRVAFTPYLTMDNAGKVVVTSSRFEMGQGSYNSLATLLADELDVIALRSMSRVLSVM